MQKFVYAVLAASVAGAALAQHPARPDPAAAKTRVPVRTYESAFKDYRSYAEPEVARWRELNEQAGRLGGHVGQVPQQPGTSSKPGAKPPAPAGHGAHK